jgi:sulfotransferase family protein
MIPNFCLIIGAMKSGTTTVYDYLKRHPQVASGPDKEPGFFAFEENWALGFDWYESQFKYDRHKHLYAVEASTDYTKYPFCKEVTERLKASTPRRFKLIYIMRHPLRRIESHARHVASTKREVGRCISPRANHSFDFGISPVSIAVSRYAYQLDVFYDFYQNGELLLLTLEQLAREPQKVLNNICQFLTIDPFFVNLEARSNVAAKDQPHSFRQNLYPVWKTLNRVALLRQVVKAVVPQSARSEIHRLAETWAEPEGRFLLNEQEAESLEEMLKPDLRRLRDIYRIDVEKEWGILL